MLFPRFDRNHAIIPHVGSSWLVFGKRPLYTCERPPARLCTQLICRHYALCLP